MPLQKQNVALSLGKGVDTKSDTRQNVPGSINTLVNSKFTKGLELVKRFGYNLLTGTATYGVAAFEDELLDFGNTALNSTNSVITVGGLPTAGNNYYKSVDVVNTFVNQPPLGVPIQNGPVTCAIHSSGAAIYVYNARRYTITNRNTNQVVVENATVANSSADTNTFDIKCFVVGSFFVLTYYNATAGNLEYCTISVSNASTISAVTIIDTITPVGSIIAYDGIISGGSLFISLAKNNSIVTYKMSSSIVVTGPTTTVTANTPRTISMWAYSNGNICTAYYDATATQVRFFILSSTLVSVLGSTLVVALAAVSKIIGAPQYLLADSSFLYIEQEASLASGVLSNTIKSVPLASNGAPGTVLTVLNSGSLVSRAFLLEDIDPYNSVYFMVAYGPPTSSGADNFESTYFLMADCRSLSTALIPVAKIYQGNAMPYQKISEAQNFFVTDVVSLSSTKFYSALGEVTNSQNLSSVIYGIGSIAVTFNTNTNYQSQEAGKSLNLTGGLLYMYDGYQISEQNFNLFPENSYITTSAVGGSITAGTYSYIALYRYTDNKGNVHRSAASTAKTIVTTGATSTNTIKVPNLGFTQKPDLTVYIDLYRNTPTAPGGNATNIFYLINSVNTSQVLASKETTFTDTVVDSAIVGFQILYTTGGVLDNSGGPPTSGMTIYKGRLIVIDAEDRSLLWFSKPIAETTPVELSADQTLFIDPRFGDITAVSVMDDKLIIFKNNAIFYITGQGPDTTGASNDFSDATFISSNAGCADPKSVVVVKDGLMFKSNKGIYLLDRGMGVSYIGAPVESYNSSTVTSAILIPNSTEVRFTLSNGTALNYDYFFQQWSVYNNINAIGATVYQSLYTFAEASTARVYQENTSSYAEGPTAATAINQSLSTSWISLAGVQGFQRLYAIYLLTEYISAHRLTVGIAYDFDTTIAQTITLDATTLAATTGTVGQWKINIDRQKCEAIQITITESTDPNNVVLGAGLNLENIGLLVGVKGSAYKLPAIQQATS